MIKNYGFHIVIFAKDKEQLHKEIAPILLKVKREIDVDVSYFLAKTDEPYCWIERQRYDGVEGIKLGLDDLVSRYGNSR